MKIFINTIINFIQDLLIDPIDKLCCCMKYICYCNEPEPLFKTLNSEHADNYLRDLTSEFDFCEKQTLY